MLRSLRSLSHSAILGSCTRMFNHAATQAACGTLRFPNSPEKFAGHIWAVKYGCNVTPVADDVRSLLILPETSIASDPSCNLRCCVGVFGDDAVAVFVDDAIVSCCC